MDLELFKEQQEDKQRTTLDGNPMESVSTQDILIQEFTLFSAQLQNPLDGEFLKIKKFFAVFRTSIRKSNECHINDHRQI